MSKNYCKIAQKWCKFLDKNMNCNYVNRSCPKNLKNKSIDKLRSCPRLAEIETVRFSQLLHYASFDIVFETLLKWYPDQKENKEGYEKVFDYLLTLKPKPHKIGDLYISVEKWEDNGETGLDVTGVDIRYPEDKRPSYAIEFMPWIDWISMFIDDNTMKNIPGYDIVAACLYEMTWFGFEEKDIQNRKDKMISSVQKSIEDLKEKK